MFALPELPYPHDALEPVMSERTLRFHHDKHHAAYVRTLNELLKASGKSPPTLEAAILDARKSNDRKLFNNAAQAWNHSFFWTSMAPRPETPVGDVAAAIDDAFGDLDSLKKAFVEEGASHFGSGWVWLTAQKDGGMSLLCTHDAENTLSHADLTPLLVCDVWEHAYYLDSQNDRKAYLTAWFDGLANWRFAASQYAAAQGSGEPWSHPAPAPADPMAVIHAT